jgi:hypothetical protein
MWRASVGTGLHEIVSMLAYCICMLAYYICMLAYCIYMLAYCICMLAYCICMLAYCICITGQTSCPICLQFITINSLFMFPAPICTSSGGTVYTAIGTFCVYYVSWLLAARSVWNMYRLLICNKLTANSASCWLCYADGQQNIKFGTQHVLIVHCHLALRRSQNTSDVQRHALPFLTVSLKVMLYSSP